MTHQEDSTSIAQAATENGCAGLAAHLSWALRLDEAQAAKVAEIAAQWSDPEEGQYAFGRCESPAERLFLLGGLLLCDEENPLDLELRDSQDPEDDYWGKGAPRWYDASHVASFSDGSVRAQVVFGSRRIDFVFDMDSSDDRPFTRLAVEIDGHDWHERTKEQAGSDRARDIAMLELGVPVIRFTGSQVYADPAGCWRSVLRVIRSFRDFWSKTNDLLYSAFGAGRERGLAEARGDEQPDGTDLDQPEVPAQ